MTDGLIAFLNARLDEDEAMVAVPHIWPTTFQPARALREVEAKRAIVERYRLAAAAPEPVVSFTAGQDDGYRQACMDAIRDLASVWSDHPDYDPEWRLTL